MTPELLISMAETVAADRGWSLATVGTYAAADGKFFRRLQSGRSCTMKTAERVTGWMSENWPAGTPWPRGVPRPATAKRRAA